MLDVFLFCTEYKCEIIRNDHKALSPEVIKKKKKAHSIFSTMNLKNIIYLFIMISIYRKFEWFCRIVSFLQYFLVEFDYI